MFPTNLFHNIVVKSHSVSYRKSIQSLESLVDEIQSLNLPRTPRSTSIFSMAIFKKGHPSIIRKSICSF